MASIVELGEVELRDTGVMTGDHKLCSAAHLLAYKIRVRKWPEYSEFYVDFELEGGAWVSIVLPENEFKKFIKLLKEVVANG